MARKSDCPIHFAAGILGDRWTLLIIRDLMFKGKKYYGELLNSEERIATNILADRLTLLEERGIIQKKQDDKHKSKLVYSLTPKGLDLLPVLTEIILWSAKYDENTAADPGFVEMAKVDRSALYAQVLGKTDWTAWFNGLKIYANVDVELELDGWNTANEQHGFDGAYRPENFICVQNLRNPCLFREIRVPSPLRLFSKQR